MIKIEKTNVFGWEAATRGMQNPMNSWEKSDSGQGCSVDFVDRRCVDCDRYDNEYEYGLCRHDKYVIGLNDFDLMKRLRQAGTDHRKYLRMIHVQADVTAPLYWWKEYDTYKVSTVANSCSTMHKIAAKEFDRGDFSHEHIPFGSDAYSDTYEIKTSDMFFCVNKEDEIYLSSEDILDFTIIALNHYREKYLATKDKKYWWQMIQLLPTSYNQKRTIDLNYENLINMYHARKNHKLDEWHDFCDWIESLPYAKELIIGGELGKDTK